MAQPPHYDFGGFYPEIDASEAQRFLAQLGPLVELDIWQLASSSPQVLGPALTGFNEPFFEAFWSSLAAVADELTTEFGPEDPENPTPGELALIAGLLPDLFARFPAMKHAALDLAVRAMGTPGDHAWTLLRAAADTGASDARPLMTDAFLEAWAAYHIAMANQYVALRSREYRFLGRVMDTVTGAPRAGVRVACEDILAHPSPNALFIEFGDFNDDFSNDFNNN